jgi:hypothetical protein
VEALAEQGYTVGMTAKGWAPGTAVDAGGRPRQMAGRPFNRRTLRPPTTGIGRNDYAANFAAFLDAAPADKPWCFWYGAIEPHRGYEYGSGAAKGGKKISDVDRVPAYWPDNATVREDLLDYAYEVEHFDEHLGRMLDLLEKKGLLDNTLVVVTSDNGMPFPRVKGQEYEFSNHLPLAMMWPAGIKHAGRRIDDYVSFIDLAPTFVELTGLTWEQTGMAPSPGRSLVPLLESDRSGHLDPTRDHVLIGKERHDVGRPHDQGYPIRGIIKNEQIYLENFEPTRWPAGNPETGYLNCDGGATKTVIIQGRKDPANRRYWELSFGRRPAEEFYDLKSDPDCMYNLASRADKAKEKDALKKQLTGELTAQQDPRMLGKGEVFERFPYANEKVRGFYERFMSGEAVRAGWVNKSDFDEGGDR